VQTYNILSFTGKRTYFANDILVFEEFPPWIELIKLLLTKNHPLLYLLQLLLRGEIQIIPSSLDSKDLFNEDKMTADNGLSESYLDLVPSITYEESESPGLYYADCMFIITEAQKQFSFMMILWRMIVVSLGLIVVIGFAIMKLR